MPTPHQVGDRAEAAVLAALLQAYETVLIPFGNGQRYDLVADNGRQLLKIQVKAGRLRNGSVVFNTHSQNPKNRSGKGVGYKGQVDLFGVYCPDTGKVYLVPPEDVSETYGYLRVTPSRNGQQKGIRLAQSYEVQQITPG